MTGTLLNSAGTIFVVLSYLDKNPFMAFLGLFTGLFTLYLLFGGLNDPEQQKEVKD